MHHLKQYYLVADLDNAEVCETVEQMAMSILPVGDYDALHDGPYL